MRKALTLIELIFTIVILSFVVMVVPKMIYTSNKQLEFSTKEDAIFNLMAKVSDVVFKEYDENNTNTDAILLDGNGDLSCNPSTGYRVGGFKSGRNCLFSDFTESHIGLDDNDNDVPDDIDDYNSSPLNREVEENGHKTYLFSIEVGYTNEWNKNYYKNSALVYEFDDSFTPSFTNIKRVKILVSQNDNNISSISYYSTNIGHTLIQSSTW